MPENVGHVIQIAGPAVDVQFLEGKLPPIYEAVLSSLFLAFAVSALTQDSRHFTFHYTFTVRNLPAGEKVRIWIPAAQSDAYQEVKIISAQGDLPLKTTSELKYGNQIFYAESNSAKPELPFVVK